MTWFSEFRIGIALLSLMGFAFLIITSGSRPDPANDLRVVWAARVLLAPLIVVAVALLSQRYWGRWLALGAALGILPWAIVLSRSVLHDWKPQLALVLSVTLFLVMVGPEMFEAFEGRSSLNWRGRALAIVRWSIIFNVASTLSLYMFAVAYRPLVAWHLSIPAIFLALLVGGAWLLGLQKVAGLFLVVCGCVGLIPAWTYFVMKEMGPDPRVMLFVVVFTPGVLLGCAALVAFGRPIIRQLFAR